MGRAWGHIVVARGVKCRVRGTRPCSTEGARGFWQTDAHIHNPSVIWIWWQPWLHVSCCIEFGRHGASKLMQGGKLLMVFCSRKSLMKSAKIRRTSSAFQLVMAAYGVVVFLVTLSDAFCQSLRKCRKHARVSFLYRPTGLLVFCTCFTVKQHFLSLAWI